MDSANQRRTLVVPFCDFWNPKSDGKNANERGD
jgi:hypothetical protein